MNLPHHDRRHPCADRIRSRSTDALCRCAVHLPAHKLGHGCRAYLHRVPHGPLEEEVHHQRRRARTGRCAGLSPISYRKTGQLVCRPVFSLMEHKSTAQRTVKLFARCFFYAIFPLSVKLNRFAGANVILQTASSGVTTWRSNAYSRKKRENAPKNRRCRKPPL